jgi:hypothetical protein
MVAESTEVSRGVAAKTTRQGKRAPVSVDMRFAIGRRIKQLTATFRERVGLGADPDPVLLAAVEKAARLTALAEDASARALRADPKVTLDDVVRLTRLADISVRRLNLDRHKAPSGPSLADIIREEQRR